MILEKNTKITGIILAGGQSSRMKQEKGLVNHLGIPFIEHIIKALKTCTTSILIITKNSDYQYFGHPCIPDIIPNCGPIGGIYTALTNTETEHNIIISCDVPFIQPIVLKNLLNNYDPEYDINCYKNNPLIGVYHKSVSELFLKNIQNQQLRLQQMLLTMKTKTILVEAYLSTFIKNINTPQEYKEAGVWN